MHDSESEIEGESLEAEWKSLSYLSIYLQYVTINKNIPSQKCTQLDTKQKLLSVKACVFFVVQILRLGNLYQ